MVEDIQHLIAIGASAGGIQPLLRLMPQIPANINAAFCVVVHIAPHSKSLLPMLLSRAGSLPAAYPENGEVLRRGKIYVAPPNHHMTVQGNKLQLESGPAENMCRPAIDPLFRTAARYLDGKVIGIILSGNLDDGTIGLGLIKECGGTAIVQNPSETAFSGMPSSAISHVNVDHVLLIDEIAAKLIELCKKNERSH